MTSILLQIPGEVQYGHMCYVLMNFPKKLVTSSDRLYVACVSAIVPLPKLLAAAMSTYGGR